MPIVVKDFTWRQTEEHIVVRVPLKGIHTSKVDICTTEQYIKANYPPFIFEVFLAKNIVESESNCLLKEGEAVFELRKEYPENWDILEAEISRSEKMKLKEQALLYIQKKNQDLSKFKLERKSKLQKIAVQRQMDYDSEVVETINSIRNNEKKEFSNDIEQWKETRQIEEINTRTAEQSKIEEKSKKKKSKKKKAAAPIFSDVPWPPVKDEDDSVIPEPRRKGTIDVVFTKREFPTPSREFAEEMEQEWLKKQAEAHRSMGFTSADLRPEENNPMWLKEKGDEFFMAKNYRAAVNAYTTGIKLASKMPALYANRAAALFNLEHFHRCIDDCSTAINLLTPPCESNLKARAGCIARRGAALCQVGHLGSGIDEMISALKLDPDNKQLKTDIKRATRKLENRDSSTESDSLSD